MPCPALRDCNALLIDDNNFVIDRRGADTLPRHMSVTGG